MQVWYSISLASKSDGRELLSKKTKVHIQQSFILPIHKSKVMISNEKLLKITIINATLFLRKSSIFNSGVANTGRST